MDAQRLDERCPAAVLEVEAGVTGRREVKKEELHSRAKHLTISGVVTMQSRRKEEKKEEERWRKLFPDIKKCVIEVTRIRFDRLNIPNLKGGRQGLRVRSRDPEQAFHWKHPVEAEDSGRGLKRFVKKVEVRVDDDPGGVHSRLRGPSILRLTRCPDVSSDSAQHRRLKRDSEGNDHGSDNKDMKKINNQSRVEHNYCRNIKVHDTPDGSSQSKTQRCEHRGEHSYFCPTAKKNLPNTMFKKLTSLPSPSPRKKHRKSCQQCEACLRENCGKCCFCLDMKKFGGPSTKRQRCKFRRCLVLKTKEESIKAGEETVTVAAQPQLCGWRRWSDEKDGTKEKQPNPTLGVSHFPPSIVSNLTCPSSLLPQSSRSFSLLTDGVSDDVTGGQFLLRLLRLLRRTVLPAHWVAVLADGPVLQLLQCSKLSSMTDTIVHVQPDRCFFVSVQDQLLPETHKLYQTHTRRITHLSQLVSLLLALEELTVCRGSRFGLRAPSPTCLLLVFPPSSACLPCSLEGGEEEEDEEEG